jgi:hypothetical protein
MASYAALQSTSLRRLAGNDEFNRGTDLYRHGVVTVQSKSKGKMKAEVCTGDRATSVVLEMDDDFLEYTCGCETSTGGKLCRHAVAAALAWHAALVPKSKAKSKPTLNDAVKELIHAGPEEIEQALLTWANENAAFKDSLQVFAARRRGADATFDLLRAQLTASIKSRLTKLNGRDWKAYTRGVETSLARLETLLAEGHPGAVLKLVGEALPLLVNQLMRFRDNRGWSEPIEQLHSLRLRALKEFPLPVGELAEILFAEESSARFEIQTRLLDRYKQYLDDDGLAAYADRLDEEILALPPVTPGVKRWYVPDFERNLFRMAQALKAAGGGEGPLTRLLSRST